MQQQALDFLEVAAGGDWYRMAWCGILVFVFVQSDILACFCCSCCVGVGAVTALAVRM